LTFLIFALRSKAHCCSKKPHGKGYFSLFPSKKKKRIIAHWRSAARGRKTNGASAKDNDDLFRSCSYKSRGRYKEQIERYLEYFPRENLHILSSEEFFLDTESELAKVFDFLGVDKEYKVKRMEPQGIAPNRTKVSSDIYDYLDDYFYPHNQALYEFLGRNFNW